MGFCKSPPSLALKIGHYFFERLVQSGGFFYPSNVGFGIAIFTFLAPLLFQSYECLHTVDIMQIAPPPLFLTEFGDSSKIDFKGKYKILRYHTNSSAPFV